MQLDKIRVSVHIYSLSHTDLSRHQTSSWHDRKNRQILKIRVSIHISCLLSTCHVIRQAPDITWKIYTVIRQNGVSIHVRSCLQSTCLVISRHTAFRTRNICHYAFSKKLGSVHLASHIDLSPVYFSQKLPTCDTYLSLPEDQLHVQLSTL